MTHPLRVLVVCRSTTELACQGRAKAPFIAEQIDSLRQAGVAIEHCFVLRGGLFGYLDAWRRMRRAVGAGGFNLVHAHYGLSGVIAVFQRQCPVVVTFHGSDINNFLTRTISRIASKKAAWRIFVTRMLARKVGIRDGGPRHSILPCGVDLRLFRPMDRASSRTRMNLSSDRASVLFAGAFANPVKNHPLARSAMAFLPNTELVELRGYTRDQVALMLNACDALLMTSHSEGSPQVVKEALACRCPVVSVDVGDVAEMITGTHGCSIVDRTPRAVADGLARALAAGRAAPNPERIRYFDNADIARQLVEIYEAVSDRGPGTAGARESAANALESSGHSGHDGGA